MSELLVLSEPVLNHVVGVLFGNETFCSKPIQGCEAPVLTIPPRRLDIVNRHRSQELLEAFIFLHRDGADFKLPVLTARL